MAANTAAVKRLLALLLVLSLAVSGCGLLSADDGGEFPEWAMSGSPARVSPIPTLSVDPTADPVVQVVQRVQPAVVSVAALLDEDAFGEPQEAVGTGFIIRSDGVIVTNWHVVEGAQGITVTAGVPPDETRFDARVVGGDPDADLAVLKAEADGLPTVKLGSSDVLQLGQPVVALGYALGLEGGPTVTSGIVSSLDRVVEVEDPNFQPEGFRRYTNVIQTDAAINPGNSGGPLVNMLGDVVGINTAGARQAENIGFAIAIDAAKPTIQEAIRNPEAPVAFLGVTTIDASRVVEVDVPVDSGAFVVATAPDAPAEAAGIATNDVIVSFDGEAVGGSEPLGRLILAREPGDVVEIGIVHLDGSQDAVTATLGTRPLPVPTVAP